MRSRFCARGLSPASGPTAPARRVSSCDSGASSGASAKGSPAPPASSRTRKLDAAGERVGRGLERLGVQRIDRDQARTREPFVEAGEQSGGRLDALETVQRHHEPARRAGKGAAIEQVRQGFEKAQRKTPVLGGFVGLHEGRRIAAAAGGRCAPVGVLRLPGRGFRLAAETFDIAGVMGDALVDFVALGRDVLVEQARGVDQRLHEVERAPDVEAEQRQSDQGEALRGRRQPVEVGLQEIGGLGADRSGAGDHAEPDRLVDGEPGESLVHAEAQGGEQQQPGLAAIGVKRAQRGEQPRDQAAAFVDVAGQVLEDGERLAGKAEPAQARLERAADLARIGVDPCAGRLVQQRFLDGGAARLGLRQRLLFEVQLAPHAVEPLVGGAGEGRGVRAETGAFLRRLLRQLAMARRQRAIERGGERALGFGGEVAGLERDNRRRARRAEPVGEPVQGAGLAGAGRREQADREGRGRVGPAQQVEQALEQRAGLRREIHAGRRGRGVGLEARRAGRGRGWRDGGLGDRLTARGRDSWPPAPGQVRLGPAGANGGEKLGGATFGMGCGQG